MTGPARPTLYKPEHASRARGLCARGATNPDLAGRFGVALKGFPETRACLYWLRNRRPEDWRAKVEATPEVFAHDIVLLDAAGERVRRVGNGAEVRPWDGTSK